MGGYKIRDQHARHFLTFQVVCWIDLFTRQRYRDILLDSFQYCRKNKDLRVHGYVIMSNHVHCILSSSERELWMTIRDFKAYTSKQIIQSICSMPESRREWMLELFAKEARAHKRNERYQIWTHENHAKELISYKFARQKLDYIHNNPVKAGIVACPTAYLYSSARNYAGMKGIMEIDNNK